MLHGQRVVLLDSIELGDYTELVISGRVRLTPLPASAHAMVDVLLDPATVAQHERAAATNMTTRLSVSPRPPTLADPRLGSAGLEPGR